MKRFISLALIFALLMTFALCFAACGGGDDKPGVSDTTAADGGGDTAATSVTETEITLEVPESLDYEGADFTVLACDEDVPYTYFEFVEEQDGDIMNDAVYERNRLAEEYLNVKIGVKNVKGIDTYQPVSAVVQAGDSDYDMVSPHLLKSISELVATGYVLDLGKVGHLNFSAPWWNSSFTDSLSIKGRLFFASGDMIVPNVRVIVFNKLLLEAAGLGGIYDDVSGGKWTLDRLGEYTKDAIADTDGDGVIGENDRHAFADLANTGLVTSAINGCGEMFVRSDGDSYILTLDSPKMVSITEKLYNYLYRDGDTKITNNHFMNGNVYFGCQVLLKLQGLRASDVDFGIIPFPMYDESQGEYYSTVWNTLVCIPVCAKDADMSGAVMETLAYYSASTLMPAYYDALLDSKFARDTNSLRMLDIIFDGLVYDMGLYFDNFMGYYSSVGTLLKNKDTNLASHFAANEPKYRAHYDEIFDSVK